MDKAQTVSLSPLPPVCRSPGISHLRKWNPYSSHHSGQNHYNCPYLLLVSNILKSVHQYTLWVLPSKYFTSDVPPRPVPQGPCTSSSQWLKYSSSSCLLNDTHFSFQSLFKRHFHRKAFPTALCKAAHHFIL